MEVSQVRRFATEVTSPISSAKLVLDLPFPIRHGINGVSGGYVSNDPSETYEVHDVVTSINVLINGTGGVAAHTDLGDGAIYGSRVITPADMGTLVEIDLSSAAIANMNSSHNRFAFGGKLATLDALANDEVVFGWTHEGNPTTELRLTLIPEPTCSLLFSIAAVMLGSRRRR